MPLSFGSFLGEICPSSSVPLFEHLWIGCGGKLHLFVQMH